MAGRSQTCAPRTDRSALLLYDGPCTLCRRSVRFLLRHEREPVLRFGSLQSESGRQLREAYAIPEQVDAVILIEEEGACWGADAALRVCRYLRPPWSLLRHLPPAPFRSLYRFIARRRTRWFGREADNCPLPDPEQRDRFL